MDTENNNSQDIENNGFGLYVILKNIFEITIFLIRLLLEIFYQVVKKLIPPSEKDVSGEIVLITGAGHGIGREIALQYIELGSRVVCVDINEKGNEETVKEANKFKKGKAFGYLCDVTDRDAVFELARKVKIEVGNVSILYNNAGVMPSHPLEQHTSDEINSVFNVNVYSHFWTIQAFMPHMTEKSRGHIVAISSIAGVVGLSNITAYCATKFAVRGMMEALSEELRSGPYNGLIKTTTIYPYMVNTGLCKNPKIKYPKILGLLDPKKTGKAIIKAQRTNILECTIPSGLLPFNNFCRCLPNSCAYMLKDFIDSGVNSDLSAK